MNFPTCWCAKALPEDIINVLDDIYRKTIALKIPIANQDDEYEKAYTSACAFWVLRTLGFLKEVMKHDEVWPSGSIPSSSLWKVDQNLVRPRIISCLEVFIKISEKYNLLPHLHDISGKILKKAKEKWLNTHSLDMYPAFYS